MNDDVLFTHGRQPGEPRADAVRPLSSVRLLSTAWRHRPRFAPARGLAGRVLAALVLTGLVACGGGSSNPADVVGNVDGGDTGGGTGGGTPLPSDDDPGVSISGEVLSALPELAAIAADPDALPGTRATLEALDVLVVQPQTGLRLVLADAALATRVSATYIEQQWLHMLDCTAQLAPVPIVIVSESPSLDPLTRVDDVVRDLEGRTMATASGGNTLHVVLADLDGSLPALGGKGFYLRSIMGRYLWTSAGLADRDYPFACARDAAS